VFWLFLLFKKKNIDVKNLNLIVVIIFIGLLSCSIIKKEHITQPKVEYAASINHWLKSNDLFYQFYILSLAPEFFTNFNLGIEIGINPIIYSPKIKMLMLYNGCTRDSCMKHVEAYINNLKPLKFAQTGGASNSVEKKDSLGFKGICFDSLNIYLKTLDGKNQNLPLNTNVDYFLILPFAKFFGNKKQLSDLKSFCNAAKSNKYSKFTIVLLDMDKQKWWGKEWNKKIDFSINVVK